MTASIAATASGNTLVIAGTPGQSIRVRSISFGATTAVNIYFTSYNGTTYTAVTGTYEQASSLGLDFQGQLKIGAGNGFGINLSGASTVGGLVTYDCVPLAA